MRKQIPEFGGGSASGLRGAIARSLAAVEQVFPDDDACLEWLWRNRCSSDGVHAFCPGCGIIRRFRRYPTKQRRQSWTCQGCGLHIHPTSGTIFHGTRTPLRTWFFALHLVACSGDVSVSDLEQQLGVTRKVARHMKALIEGPAESGINFASPQPETALFRAVEEAAAGIAPDLV
jgi:transposase-like protein